MVGNIIIVITHEWRTERKRHSTHLVGHSIHKCLINSLQWRDKSVCVWLKHFFYSLFLFSCLTFLKLHFFFQETDNTHMHGWALWASSIAQAWLVYIWWAYFSFCLWNLLWKFWSAPGYSELVCICLCVNLIK